MYLFTGALKYTFKFCWHQVSKCCHRQGLRGFSSHWYEMEEDHTLHAGLALDADKLDCSSKQQATVGGEMAQVRLLTILVAGPWKTRLAPCWRKGYNMWDCRCCWSRGCQLISPWVLALFVFWAAVSPVFYSSSPCKLLLRQEKHPHSN